METAPSSSDEAAQVSSVTYYDLTSSWCSLMTQYLIIHHRSLYNPPPAGLLPRARILVSRVANFIED